MWGDTLEIKFFKVPTLRNLQVKDSIGEDRVHLATVTRSCILPAYSLHSLHTPCILPAYSLHAATAVLTADGSIDDAPNQRREATRVSSEASAAIT